LARIALDAMGGDHAPHATIAGALLALAELDAPHSLQLVGRSDDVRRELDTQLARDAPIAARARERLTVVDAPQVVEMSDKPAAVLRVKANSSMAVGLKLQAAGHSDAFVSAGNTGAQMAASTLILKLHEGLTRPAIGTVFPTVNHPVVVLDSGANVDCSAEELVQFARLGATYAEDILGRKNPAVGLLSIGEEAEKGNAAVKEAHQALLESDLNFQGNVEGRDILTGATDRGPIDVVVCDGFVGNVLLKFYESVPPMILALLARSGIDPVHLRRAFSKEFDYSEHGGAPLLGVRGVSIISHGKSSPNAIKNAILVALRAVESRMTEHIGRRLSQSAKESA
jgi:glycerol-3-phosphate acyltransferase PlsX